MAIADKFDLGFVGRLMRSRNGTVVGTLGDLLKSPRARDLYKEALGVPVMVLDRPVQGGKFVDSPDPNLRFFGACGSLRGKACIFVNPRWGEEETIRTLLEEGAHALRKLKGRPATKQDITALTSENIGEMHDSLPEEVSARQMAEHVMRTASGDDPWFSGSHVRVLPTNSRETAPETPLTVYHGTAEDIESFQVGRDTVNDWGVFGPIATKRYGIFFAENPEYAGTFARARGGGVVIPVHLAIKNPFYMDSQSLSDDYGKAAEAYDKARGGDDEEGILRARKDFQRARWLYNLRDRWEVFDGPGGREFVQWLKDGGHDGAYLEEEGHGLGPDAGPQRVWVALDPSQVRRVQQKAAAMRGIWFHGSSIKNLEGILHQGLVPILPDPSKRNWAEDPDASHHSPSRESYGGIYVTRNLLTAVSSPRDHNAEGREVVVCLDLQPSSFYMDEDAVVFMLQDAIGGSSHVDYYALPTYLAAAYPDKSTWGEYVQQARDKYTERVVRYVRGKFHETALHPGLEGRLRELVPAVFVAALARVASHMAPKTEEYYVRGAWARVFAPEAGDTTPPIGEVLKLFPTPEQGEEMFRTEAEKFTRALRKYARPEGKLEEWSRETARVMAPIGYSGSNRITAVVECRDGRKYRSNEKGEWDMGIPAKLIIHWGQIPPEFFQQWNARIGDNYIVERAPEPGKVGQGKSPKLAGTEAMPQSVPSRPGWSYEEPLPDRSVDFFELVENPHTDRGRETRVEESGSPPPEGGEGKPARGEPGQEGTLVRPMASARRKYPIVIDRNGWLDSKGKFTPVPENQAHLEVGEAEVRVICYPPMVEFDIQADSPRVREVVKEALRDNPNLQEVTIEIEGEEFEESMLPERAEELLDSYRWTPSLRRPMAAMDSPLLRAKAGVAEELGEPKASIDYRLFRLLPSPVHGTGVFADCDIPRGSHLDLFPSGERFVRNEDLPPGQQQTYDWFGVKDEAKGGYWVPPDMGNKDKGWYLNHSGHPNAASKTPGGQLYAARDIKREEEILIDYASLGPGNLTKEAADLSLFAGVSSPAQLPSADEFAGRYGANRKASYGQLREFLSGLPSPLTVYRALKLPSRHPYTQGFGVCWSWDESGAIPYEGEDDWEPKLEVDAYDDSYEDRGGYRTYVFRGEVAPESVDWGRTVWANLGHPMEKEVTLRDRAPLRLTGWKRRHSTRWQRPVREHVTASSSAGEGTARAAAFEKTALNVPRLVQDFGRKLVERYEADFPQRPKGTTTPEAIVESLTLFDPTDNNEYTAWLAGSYARGELGKYQDLPEKVAPLLGRFHSLKKTKNLRPEDTNIQKVRGIAKLEALLAEYAEIEAASRRQRAQAMEQGFYRKKEATLLHDDGEVKVVVPHTKEASKFFGINTKWCTAAEENNAFEGYNEDGPLYIVLLKRENKRFQFHFPTAQFTDEQDRPLGVREWMRQHPKVAGILYPLSSDFRSSCEDCTGEGYRQCGRCEGTGHEQCGDCDGDGEERCSDCQGSGKQGEEGEDCDSCEGKGYVTCETCNGGGNVSCGECEGTGRTECDSCGGSGTNPEMEEFIIGCEEAGVAPRTTHRRPPAPPRKQQPAGRWPELRRRVREWIEPRRTPVHVGPRGMAFLQWLEGVKRRLKGRGRRGASAKAAAALASRKPALAYDISEAEACTKSWPRLDGLRPYALEEAFGSPVPSLLTIYHAGPTDIRPGVFVTTDRGYAEEFLEPGERIWEKKDIPLADFQAYGEGRIVGRNRHTGSEGVELIYNPLPKGRRPKTAAGEWWRRWRKTEVIPRGTVLYHGTAEDFPAGDLGFPAWFSTSRSVAEHFQSWHGGKYPRVLAYRALRPIRLPRIDSREEMEAFGEMFGMESVVEGYGAEEMAEDMLKSSLPGWILPHNYPDGDDILLAASDGIEFTGEEPEPRGGTEEEGEDRQGSAPPDPGDAGFFQTEYRGEGEWVQDPATGHYSYRKSPAEAEAWGKRQKAAGELASARATGGEQRLPASLAIFRGEGGSSRRGGHYWSPDREWAAQFTQSGRAEELLQAEIMAKDIYEPSPLPYAGDPEEVRAAVRQARKAGFRAVWLDEGAREPRSVYVFGGSALYRL